MTLEVGLAEGRYAADTASPDDAEALYDRQWALRLLDLSLDRLRAEFAGVGKGGEYEILKNCLMAERGAIDYASIATRLVRNEGAARVAVHRLRKRFREIYREEIARTVEDESDLDEEIRWLAAALAGAKPPGHR